MALFPCTVQYIPAAYYFVQSSFYLLTPYPGPLSTGNN